MRLLNTFFQRIAIGKRGAISEPGDAELVVPPVYQIGGEIPAAVSSLAGPPAGTTGESHWAIVDGNRIGAVAAGTVVGATKMAAGLWRLTGMISVSFVGTLNVNNDVEVGLQDPDGALGSFFTCPLVAATVIEHRTVNILLHLLRDDFVPAFTFSATVAGDNLRAHIRWFAARLL